VPGITKIRLEEKRGTVALVPSDDGKLHVEARVTGWGPSADEAGRRARMMKVNIDQGEMVTISRTPDDERNVSREADIRYRVKVPKGVMFALDNTFGNIKADNIEAGLEITAGHGNLLMSGIKGNVKVMTGSGQVFLNRIEGDADVFSESGNLRIDNVSGNIRAESSHGNISVAAGKPVTANYNVTTSAGQVVLRIPEASDATVSALTGNGSISGTLDLVIKERNEEGPEHPGQDRTGSIVLGNGKGSITLRSENGSIIADKN